MSDNNCFIIMPISTPSDLVDTYSNDIDHFKHVLDYLFIPAIEQVGMVPIPPKTKGSEIIQAEIIKNIESAGFVLCDMSTLNANVFFELGIRTAVNKSVALVKDDATERVPFDTHIINNHTYLRSLEPWVIKSEIEKLADHLKHCCSSQEKTNSLWKYFSLTSRAVPLEKEISGEDKTDYLIRQVDALRQELRTSKAGSYAEQKKLSSTDSRDLRWYRKLINMIEEEEGIIVTRGSVVGDTMKLVIPATEILSSSLRDRLANVASAAGYKLDIEYIEPEEE